MFERTFLVALGLLLAGCVEYDVTSSGEVAGEPNPKTLENPVQVDRITQVTTPAVDVLWIIDNSGSMGDEQADLTAAFPTFMDFFLGSGLDYHVGVVSTDIDTVANAGVLETANGVQWIEPETPYPTEVFSAMAGLGTNGSSSESGIGAAYHALELKKDGTNKGFLREDASLHCVLISDENDHTNGNPITNAEFIGFMLGLKPDTTPTTWSSVVNCPNGTPGCVLGTPWDEEAGTDYIDVTLAVGGILWEIHKGDWDGVLEALGVQAAGLKREYFLSQLPVEDTIVVYVIDQDVRYDFVEGDDWTYDATRNSILFLEYVPQALSQVNIEYTVLAAYQE